MATDTSFGEVRKFEDFLVTIIGDLPEIDIATVSGGTTEISSTKTDGRVEISTSTSDGDDVGAVTFGALNWLAGNSYLKMEARFELNNLTDNKYFIGFGDNIASTGGGETGFDMASDTVTIGTMEDSIGIGFDQDATTKNLWCLSANNSSITVEKVLGSKYNPVAGVPTTFGVYLSLDRKSAVFYVDNEEVYRVDSDSVLIDAVDLVPGVWVYEQATVVDLDLDYLYGSKGRSST